MMRTMCDVTRRNLLFSTAVFAGAAQAADEVNKAVPLAKDVYFHQGDIEHQGHCNNGWIIFKDYVLVIDANFPSGAQNIIPKIRALTSKPIRFAFDTHHHGDHAYGNQVWVDNGATPVAHTGVIEEMRRYETGYYGNTPGRWEEAAKTRPDVAASRLTPPSVLFPRELFFDDGEHRVELIHLGVAHTHGDAMAWLPKEKILFSGDACVNGPFNFVGDGNVEKWIGTLDNAKKLGAQTLCPGHGPRGDETVLADQQLFFQALSQSVRKRVKEKQTSRQVSESVSQIRDEILAQPRIERYAGKDGLGAQVEKVYNEMTGESFPSDTKASHQARLLHRHAHAAV
jgi:glyoxylase-like metal-dependent hydrolase (beta-lactamase superfamily II)